MGIGIVVEEGTVEVILRMAVNQGTTMVAIQGRAASYLGIVAEEGIEVKAGLVVVGIQHIYCEAAKVLGVVLARVSYHKEPKSIE